MIIENDKQRHEAMIAIKEYDQRKLEFEVGQSYQWIPGAAMHNQGQRYGLLKCIHVGVSQGLFTSVIEAVGAFENAAGLHIIATAHLKSGQFVKVS